MSDSIIKLLPEALANQIAAGEVVQRPASVVKELMENALDAGATEITLYIKDAGRTLIQVIDNGKGMSSKDATQCFLRHATSKIAHTDDLFRIQTMGFRGEALASIAAVAQVELKTKRAEDEVGCSIRIEGSQILNSEEVVCAQGTSISVKNLFFNVPARRQFLKSNPIETKHILDEFTRIALAYPEKQFQFYQGDLETFRLHAGKLSQRIVALLGQNYREQLVVCEESTPYISIKGYIAQPAAAKRNRGEQFFFVNHRFVKSPYLHHAVVDAFEGLLSEGTHPFYALFIDIDPKHIDVNVHPTKTEIKFDDERTIYGIIHSVVRKAINTHHLSVGLNFEESVHFNPFQRTTSHNPTVSSGTGTAQGYHLPDKNPSLKSNQARWQELYQHFEKNAPLEAQQVPISLTFPSQMHQINLVKEEDLNEKPITEPQKLFQLHQQYIVAQVKSGMMLIDQQAAHERILYEKYKDTLYKNTGASQQFLFPQTIELGASDFSLVQSLEKEIHRLGFSFQVFGTSAIVIQGIPSEIRQGEEKSIFEAFIEQFKHHVHELKMDKNEKLARSLASKACIKKNTKLTQPEMASLIDQLFACEHPQFGPKGNPVLHILDLGKIALLFER